LGDHHGPAGESGAADAGDGEELAEALDVAGVTHDLALDFDLGVDVVQVASGE
jgi:hypothetical protein